MKSFLKKLSFSFRFPYSLASVTIIFSLLFSLNFNKNFNCNLKRLFCILLCHKEKKKNSTCRSHIFILIFILCFFVCCVVATTQCLLHALKCHLILTTTFSMTSVLVRWCFFSSDGIFQYPCVYNMLHVHERAFDYYGPVGYVG